MKRGRKVRSDELELWKQVAREISPIERARRALTETAKDRQEPAGPPSPREPPAMPKISGGKVPLKDDIAPPLSQSLGRQPVRMDHKSFKRMRQGRVQPDARIDLHGMTLDRAHGALVRFVMGQHATGKRLLLVITGKGKPRVEDGPIPARLGVLRHQVPEWLRLPPLGGIVLQVTQAHLSHGGEGAYYVYLRRPR